MSPQDMSSMMERFYAYFHKVSICSQYLKQNLTYNRTSMNMCSVNGNAKDCSILCLTKYTVIKRQLTNIVSPRGKQKKDYKDAKKN